MPKRHDENIRHFVAEDIRRTINDLSTTERRIARVLLSNYPAAGLEPAGKLAERAGASAPTVTRYIARLGFSGYRDFQQALRDEMDARQASPITLPSKYGPHTPAARILKDAAETASALLIDGFAGLPAHGFGEAVDLLADPSHRITAAGGRFSRLQAQMLDLHLRMLRADTRAVDVSPHETPQCLIELEQRDVLVIFDFRRYQRDIIQFANDAHERHAKVILITDVWLSPISEFADLVLPLRTQNTSPFDSLVPATAIVEALATAVLTKMGKDANTRMRTLEQLAQG